MSTAAELQNTLADMVQAGKGILAADESSPTIEKRFKAIDVNSTEENRMAYRELLLSTAGLGDYISGVILFEETLNQHCTDGNPLTLLASRQGIVPGIKVDKGLIPLAGSQGEKITAGLDGLQQRLVDYKQLGARFAKWRCVYTINGGHVSSQAIEANAEVLARYAAICQGIGIVPIVEPEVLMDGAHSIDDCATVTEAVQRAVFAALYRHNVALEHILLKPNMILPGQEASRCSPDEIAEFTLGVIKRSVPAAVPSINFLSGGQTPEEATDNLAAINQARGNNPWLLSFSYGRALQQPVLQAWGGKAEQVEIAQQQLLLRARLNAEKVVDCTLAKTDLKP